MSETKTKSLYVKRKFFVYFQVSIFCLLILFPKISSAEEITPQKLINLTNRERANHNLSSLSVNDNLTRAAQAKAKDMITKGYFSHSSPDGLDPWHWIKQTGYNYTYAGENLAMDFIDSSDVVKAWMESSTHRKNILNANYKEIGIAVANGTIEGSDTTVVVQMFGSLKITEEAKEEQKTESPPPAPAEPVAAAPVVKTEASAPPQSRENTTVQEEKTVVKEQDVKPDATAPVYDQNAKTSEAPQPSHVTLRSYFIIPNLYDLDNSALFFAGFSEPVKLAKIQYGRRETYLNSCQAAFYCGRVFLIDEWSDRSAWKIQAQDLSDKELVLILKNKNAAVSQLASAKKVLGIQAATFQNDYLFLFLTITGYAGLGWIFINSRKKPLSLGSEFAISLMIAVTLLGLLEELPKD